MFLENSPDKARSRGWIEVICGSMFSGKTEELIRRMKRAKIAKQQVEIFKPVIDTRYHETSIVSHDSNAIHSTPVHTAADILTRIEGIEVVGIDEAQFFDDKLPDVCNELANRGLRVIAAGLDMDYLGKPFGPMPAMMSIAEYVTKVHAICMSCGNLAQHSYRKVAGDDLILLGEKDSYMALCRSCFTREMKL